MLIGSRLYSAVTNATSQKPLAPLVVMRGDNEFFAAGYGATLRSRAPTQRWVTTAVVLDVFIPGGPVPPGTTGIVELEQGETYGPDGQGRLRPLRPDEIGKTWTGFRFAFPPLE